MNELIVDSRHCDELVELLADLPDVLPADHYRETDDNLDLTLVGPLDLRTYFPAARKEFGDETELAVPTEPTSFIDGSPIDLLVYDLRRRFADRHGFMPVLEGNGGDVQGDPQHKAVGPASLAPQVHIPTTSYGEGVHIGMIDTALTEHPDLPPTLVYSDVVHKADVSTLWAGHGTFGAGIIRQQAPAATIHLRAGLASDTGMGTRWQLAKLIAAFADQQPKIQILNLSLGFTTADGQAPQLMARALSRLGSDVLVIAAAGNSGEGRRWPGAFGAVIDVSSARDDVPMTTAPSWVDALAPGTNVTSTYLFGEVVDDALPAAKTFYGYAKWNGTSFATAFVSGAVAAAMTKYDLTAPEALKRLFDEPTVSKVAKHGD